MSTVEVVPEAGRTGGDVLQVTGYERIVFDSLMRPFDPEILYRLRVRVKNTVRPVDPARNKVRVGVEGLAADGETLAGVGGRVDLDAQYFVAAEYADLQAEPLDTWRDFVGFIRGQGAYAPNAVSPEAPSGVDPAVAYITPVVWVNCTDGDGTVQIDEVALDAGVVAVDTASVGSVSAGLVSRALEPDPASIPNQGYIGRAMLLTVNDGGAAAFGQVMVQWPSTGKMHAANIEFAQACGVAAVAVEAGSGSRLMALPGSVIRDDSLSLLPGRDVYLHPQIVGTITQVEPYGTLRWRLGKAVAPNMWYFDPEPMATLTDSTPYFARMRYMFPNPHHPCSIFEWNGYLYVGTRASSIWRSGDYGLTWTLVYYNDSGGWTNIRAFAAMGSSLYAVIVGAAGGWSHCVRTNDGVNWYAAAIGSDPYVTDICKFHGSDLLIAAVANYSTRGKIYSSTDGVNWTLRYTTSAANNIARVTNGPLTGTYTWAVSGDGDTVKLLRTSNGTSWTVAATLTGQMPADMITYIEPVNGLQYTCTMISDNGRIYGGRTDGTGTPSTLETTQSVAWTGFILLDGFLHAIGNEGSFTARLWRRRVVSDGSGGWAVSWVKVMDGSNLRSDRFVRASDGFVYFVSERDTWLWRVGMRADVLV